MYIMGSSEKSDQQLLQVEFINHGLKKYDLNPNISPHITNIFINCKVKFCLLGSGGVVISNSNLFVPHETRNLATIMKNSVTLTTLSNQNATCT